MLTLDRSSGTEETALPVRDRPQRVRVPGSAEPLSVILKLYGDACNIDCTYCYEKRKPYDQAQVITPELLRAFLQRCGGRPLALELHGGEPLLVGRARMEALVAELKRYPAVVRTSIQTNGTLLDDRWIDFFREHLPGLEIGVSLDGDPQGNAHRVDYRGAPTHHRVEEALGRLARSDVQVGLISVVTRGVLGRAAETLRYFRSFPAVRYVKFAPCLDFNVSGRRRVGRRLPVLMQPGDGIPTWGTTPAEYADFIIEAYEAWKEEGLYRSFLLEPVGSIVRSLTGGNTPFCHFSSKKCAFVLTLYPDGTLGSCDEFSMPDARLAHVDEIASIDDVAGFSTNPVLLRDLERMLEKCAQCPYQETCRGGCLSTRRRYLDTVYDEAYCAHRIRLIDHVARDVRPLAGAVDTRPPAAHPARCSSTPTPGEA